MLRDGGNEIYVVLTAWGPQVTQVQTKHPTHSLYWKGLTCLPPNRKLLAQQSERQLQSRFVSALSRLCVTST